MVEYNKIYKYKGYTFNIKVVLWQTAPTSNTVGIHGVVVNDSDSIGFYETYEVIAPDLIKELKKIKKEIKSYVKNYIWIETQKTPIETLLRNEGFVLYNR